MKKLLLAVAALVTFSASAVSAAVESMPVKFQDIPQVMVLFTDAPEYQKKAVTLGRLPHEVEIGRAFKTYVADEDGKPTVETENVVNEQVIIARNPEPISGAVYNEWLVPRDKWESTYGELPMFDRFMPFKRVSTIKAIPITEDLLTLLGSQDGETALIAVEWNDQGMKVYKDGYLVESGYGIAPDEMGKTYELVEE
ncbi:hypothetical protein C9I98_08240 [Photobacterium sanctipauli]|uniref:Uncharacterized protein n=1 Tax=Photobacterium sanctipauli TaxID=1342794 RepID=A0A2T3NWZ3_9GAMM|nr:hypothetical protein [Photobacterium sanctipauli]PSW20817.1 hypothetical protein C9I98_08240 [Photobacterium sanctipauli]